jgi:hypothetical protein
MTALRMFTLAVAVTVFAAAPAFAQGAKKPSDKPTTGSGQGTATTAPGSEKRPDATNDKLSDPGKANPPSGVTPGGGKTGTAPTTPGHTNTTDQEKKSKKK